MSPALLPHPEKAALEYRPRNARDLARLAVFLLSPPAVFYQG